MVERNHVEGAEPLAKRMGVHERGELAREFAVASAPQPRFPTVFEGGQVQFFQSRRQVTSPIAMQVGARLTPRNHERLIEQGDGGFEIPRSARRPTQSDQTLELAHVDRGGLRPEPVPARHRLDQRLDLRSGAQNLSEVRDIQMDGGDGPIGRILRPRPSISAATDTGRFASWRRRASTDRCLGPPSASSVSPSINTNGPSNPNLTRSSLQSPPDRTVVATRRRVSGEGHPSLSLAPPLRNGTTVTTFDVTPMSRALGAEVRGVDLNTVSDADIEQIRALLLEHLVLFFPGQAITLDAHVALGRRFGNLEINPNLPGPAGAPPEVVELKASFGGIADEWHTDVTFLPQPSVLSILNYVTGPALGGDTMWSNQFLAFSELSLPMQELLRGLSALHDATPHGKPEMTAIHPVVRTHPESGREALFVNEHFTRRIVEMSYAESQMLLDHLRQWSSQARFTVRYRWTPGTIAMWDNRCTQHFVVNDFDGERIIQRVTVLGDVPTGPGPRWEPFVSAQIGAASIHDRPLDRHLASARSLVSP